jgi:hypothetical protein
VECWLLLRLANICDGTLSVVECVLSAFEARVRNIVWIRGEDVGCAELHLDDAHVHHTLEQRSDRSRAFLDGSTCAQTTQQEQWRWSVSSVGQADETRQDRRDAL